MHQQFAQRHHPGEFAVAVGDIEIEHHLLFLAPFLDAGNGLPRAQLSVKAHEIGGHESTGGLGMILEQFLLSSRSCFPCACGYRWQSPPAGFEQVDGVVGRHVGKDIGHHLRRHFLDQIDYQRIIEFAQKFPDAFGLGDDIEDSGTLFIGKMAKYPCDISRMGF